MKSLPWNNKKQQHFWYTIQSIVSRHTKARKISRTTKQSTTEKKKEDCQNGRKRWIKSYNSFFFSFAFLFQHSVLRQMKISNFGLNKYFNIVAVQGMLLAFLWALGICMGLWLYIAALCCAVLCHIHWIEHAWVWCPIDVSFLFFRLCRFLFRFWFRFVPFHM